MPWVLSGCWESSNLTNERISISTHNGNSRTGKRSKRPKGKNCKADSAWNRRAPEGLPGVPQDRCWGPATGAELQSGEAYACSVARYSRKFSHVNYDGSFGTESGISLVLGIC